MAQLQKQKETGQDGDELVDANLELNLAIAVYLATYTGINVCTRDFINSLEGQDHETFHRFLMQYYVPDFKSGLDDDFSREVKSDIDVYRTAMKRIVDGDTRQQTKMLGLRKFLSIPWLICPDQMIGNLR